MLDNTIVNNIFNELVKEAGDTKSVSKDLLMKKVGNLGEEYVMQLKNC